MRSVGLHCSNLPSNTTTSSVSRPRLCNTFATSAERSSRTVCSDTVSGQDTPFRGCLPSVREGGRRGSVYLAARTIHPVQRRLAKRPPAIQPSIIKVLDRMKAAVSTTSRGNRKPTNTILKAFAITPTKAPCNTRRTLLLVPQIANSSGSSAQALRPRQ